MLRQSARPVVVTRAGRVVAVYQHLFRVGTDQGELLAELAGKLRHRAKSREALPAIGDLGVPVLTSPKLAVGRVMQFLAG